VERVQLLALLALLVRTSLHSTLPPRSFAATSLDRSPSYHEPAGQRLERTQP
jgi:hypothetical protein